MDQRQKNMEITRGKRATVMRVSRSCFRAEIASFLLFFYSMTPICYFDFISKGANGNAVWCCRAKSLQNLPTPGFSWQLVIELVRILILISDPLRLSPCVRGP